MFVLRILNYLGMMCKLIFRAFTEVGDVKREDGMVTVSEQSQKVLAVLTWIDDLLASMAHLQTKLRGRFRISSQAHCGRHVLTVQMATSTSLSVFRDPAQPFKT